MSVKEIRFNANTDSHDIEFKTRHLKQFLMDGHKVKATVIYKGRMITHPEFGRQLMEDILSRLGEVGKIESPPKMEGKMLTTYLVPDKAKIQVYKTKMEKENKNRPVPEEKVEDIKTE
jgi:translation initiation factor IF-3